MSIENNTKTNKCRNSYAIINELEQFLEVSFMIIIMKAIQKVQPNSYFTDIKGRFQLP